MSICDLPALSVDRQTDEARHEEILPTVPQTSARRCWRAGSFCAVVLVAGLVLRVIRLAMNGPLWGDEAMLVRSLLDRTAGQLFEPLDYVQIAPLGFLWGELICRQWLGTSEWVWRLLPTIAGCLGLIGLADFARRVLPKHAAWLTVAIAASSFYLIRHTVEMKPYIWDFAFAVGLLQLGWRIHQQPQAWNRWLVFGGVSAIGVWCSFPSAFVAGGVLLSLLPVLSFNHCYQTGGRGWSVSRSPSELGSTDRGFVQCGSSPGRPVLTVQWSRAIAWLCCGLMLSASFLAMYLFFGRVQVKTAHDAGYWQYSMWEVAFPPWTQPLQLVWWLIREHTGSMMAHPFGGKNFASVGTSLLVLSGSVTLARRNPQLLGLLLAPAGVGFLAACLQKYPYGGTARTMLYLAAAICLLAGMGGWALIVRFLEAKKRRQVFAAAMCGALALMAGKLALEIACPYKQYSDWVARETIQRWADESAPEDIWVIANAATTPDRTDHGIYGGMTVAVFDHYTQLNAGAQAVYPRQFIDCPRTSGRVLLLVHESRDWPLTIEVGEKYAARFAQQAQKVHEECVPLSDRETLRKLVFTKNR